MTGPTQNTIRSRWKQIGTSRIFERAFRLVRHKIQFDQGESKSEPWLCFMHFKERSDTKYNSIKVKANRNCGVVLMWMCWGPTQNTIRSRWKQIGTCAKVNQRNSAVRHKIQFDQGESKSELDQLMTTSKSRSDTKYNSIKVKANRNGNTRIKEPTRGPTQNTIRSRWKQIGTRWLVSHCKVAVRHKIQFDQGESKSEL